MCVTALVSAEGNYWAQAHLSALGAQEGARQCLTGCSSGLVHGMPFAGSLGGSYAVIMRRRAIIAALLALGLVIAYSAVRYVPHERAGVWLVYDRFSNRQCAVTWSDFNQLCDTTFALWLYKSGLWRSTEDAFGPGHMDYVAPPITDGLAAPCESLTIVHIGNRGTTLGLSDGHVYYITPMDNSQPEQTKDRLGWRDGGSVQLCIYKDRTHRYYFPKIDNNLTMRFR